ncbi:MAG TPA: NlpC/P60 family protein [Pirellulales bacterium]
MQIKLNRREAICVLSGAFTTYAAAPLAMIPSTLCAAHDERQSRGSEIHDRASGYTIRFAYPLDELIGDLIHGERGDPERESETPHHQWYTAEIRRRSGAWGPEARAYEPLPELAEKPTDWLRQRVIATAARLLGYGYQHHHVPDWDPPADWPWKPCCVGHNGRGVDCSNFTGFVYNQGFGLRMSSGIERQSELRSAMEERHESITLHRIALPQSYEERSRVLRTGDLVYIRGREDGPITHVILWIGDLGQADNDVPLIMDSHGGGVDNDAGEAIPCGIHLRPFREDSWYNRCASHAHRLFA